MWTTKNTKNTKRARQMLSAHHEALFLVPLVRLVVDPIFMRVPDRAP